MGKDGNFSGGAKVYESKKEKKRRLVANKELEAEEFVITPHVEVAEDGNNEASGMPSIVMEKGGYGEERVVGVEAFSRKFGDEANKENYLEMRSDGKCMGIGVDQPGCEEIKYKSVDFAGNQTDATGASTKGLWSPEPSYNITGCAEENISKSNSVRKRNMKICDDEFSRKRTKHDHMASVIYQTEKSGRDNTPTIGEYTGEGMDSAMNDVPVSKLPVTLSKERVAEGSSKTRLLRSRTGSKSKAIKQQGRSGRRNHQNVKDVRFSDIGLKNDENSGRATNRYIRVQSKNVKGVLQGRKKVAARGDGMVQDSTRRLRSSVKNKFSTSNHRLETQLGQKPIYNMKHRKNVRKTFSEEEGISNFSKINQKIIYPKEGSKNAKLLHNIPDLAVRNANNINESVASRGAVKRKLREQIKNILVDAGWKIEFRPRNNRDYEDAVYISPHGGAGYWSIVKAYDVYLSEFCSACNDKEGSKTQFKTLSNSEEATSTFTVIPPELLLLLKKKVINRRRTKKEMEEVRRRKELEDGKRKVRVGRRKKKGKEVTKIRNFKDKGIRDEVGGKIAMKRNLIVRNNKSRGCALLVRGSDKDEGSENGDFVPYVWKRTVLSWMIDLGLLTNYGKARYMNKRRSRALLDGRITRDGIQCSCCSKIFSVSKFEIHAGSKLHQPYENICMEVSGISLLQYQINAWEKQESKLCIFYDVDTDGDDPNDDTCGICGDGGDLICCDSCPSTFHLGCLGIEMLPSGDWHCTNCTCKYCGAVHDPASQYGNASSSFFTCSQCAQKYHKDCVPEAEAVSNISSSSSNMFCGRSCRKVFRKLQKLIGVRNKLETGFYWSIVHRFDDPSKPLPRMAQRVESNSKIAIAYAVMDECFAPIIDQRSGINLIHSVVYNCGANFNRLNFSGFYTFILERGDEIIAVASVRIHDTKLAEMPFIGTRSMYRRQGMCRRLLKGIESALRSLCINKLIIPAISELTETWTTVFGFKPLEISQKEEVKSVNMLVFPDTGLLQKSLIKDSKKQRTNPDLENKPESEISVEVDKDCSADETIDSKESKCDAEAIQPNLPVSEHATNLVPEASGCDVQLCRSVEGAANVESNDLQYVCFCSNHVEKDLSPQNCSNEKVSFTEVPKKEVGDVTNAFAFQHPSPELLFTAAAIEVSDCRSPKIESKFELHGADLLESCNYVKEDENTLPFLQKVKGKPHCNGGLHDASLEKCVTEEDEDTTNNTNELKLTDDTNGLESNVNEEDVDGCIDVIRHSSTSPGLGTWSEVCGNGCGANPKLSCVSSNESSSLEKSELPPNQLKCYLGANNSAPLVQLAVSGSANRLDVEGVNGIVRTKFTTYDDLSKLEDSTAGLRRHFTSTSKAGDVCHDDVCDVRIAEKRIDLLEPSHGFDLSTVKQTSKMVT